ncbi:MAG: HgcAB-like fusion protein [Gemmatimonadota bacterium]
MSRLRSLWVEVIGTLFRVLPFPCRTGLFRIGHPGRDAPVLLTGNFRVTVERVRRALRGLDAYLLVANSHGLNVWCAATGGHLTNHDVLSVLKTSDVERHVDHRRVILPQLAGTGIQGKEILHKAGWRVEWGPVYAADLPAYLGGGRRKTAAMRRARFPWPQRLEMAVAWAFPISLVFALLVAPWWPAGIGPTVGLVWGLALLIFLGFPLYAGRLKTRGRRAGFVFFDVGEHGGPLLVWLLFVAGLLTWQLGGGAFSWGTTLRWGFVSLAAVLTLSLDLAGSTPVFKSGLHADRRLRIVLEPDRCRGAAFCEQVCPVEVFRVDEARRLATLPGAQGCVQCGACVVQCPFDALRFEGPEGEIVTPEVVRTFKLNLLGHRAVRSDARPGGEVRRTARSLSE